MTATTEVRPLAVAGRTVRAEWTRLWTVRTSWWCLLATAVGIVGMAALLGMDVASDEAAGVDRTEPWPPVSVAGELALLVGQFGLYVLVLLAVTSEDGSGAITTSLQWTARRRTLLLTRTAVVTVTAVGLGLLLVLAGDLLAWTIAPVLELGAADLAASLARVGGVLAAGCLLAAGLGFLLRSTAGALASVFLLMLVLPLSLPAFGIGWLETVGTHLPGGAAVFLLGEELDGLTRTSAAVVLAAWAAAATAAGAVSFLRRDAD